MTLLSTTSLQRPRDASDRTALMAALITFYGLAWSAGGNDIIATQLHLSINQITHVLRVAVLVGPLIAFWVTRRWCLSLQRADLDRQVHGRETGVIDPLPRRGPTPRSTPRSVRPASWSRHPWTPPTGSTTL